MDRYEFETNRDPLNHQTTLTPSYWISTVEYLMPYLYPTCLSSGIIFSLLTLIALVQRVYITSKPYLFMQSIIDSIFLITGAILTPNYYHFIPTFFSGRIYINALHYACWFIIIWIFLIACLDHTITCIQSNGYNEKLFCSPFKTRNIIVLILLMGIISAVPQIFAWEQVKENIFHSTPLKMSFLYEQIYFWYIQIIVLFVPVFSIFVFIGALLYTLCKKREHYLLNNQHHHQHNHISHYTINYGYNEQDNIQRLNNQERQNLSKLFLFSCFLHLLLVMPYSFVIFFGKLFSREQQSKHSTITGSLGREILIAYDSSLLLVYINILMRFFVYVIFSGKFRLCLRKMFTCRCCCCYSENENLDDV
ncbi:unnamed protein product [Didymodactylos carnosus]|uniref:G-protein coupled receptors family 1 profile domain-containing protein n=1 Tax=Didymodactylos carnosus TaxID=1234261 RepID=A0A813QEJ3_9BILA|nr:unnamed protein product [Didymodactylos carnosus]CAF1483484.1 unnamed protein product [Didymodactylos carnosus]CAF3547328.1 unnamed protein product [Didymodactylos carnosus]CAF4273665.1 unnamed protein product [Didymodactylos carnosus]